jgi:hypothetical protein
MVEHKFVYLVYCIVSLVLLCFPNMKHGGKRQRFS